MSVYDLSVPRPPAPDPEELDHPTPSTIWRRLGRGGLTLLGALFYFVGWLAGSLMVPLGFAGRWVVAAIATGWDDASTSWHRTGRIEP